MKKKKGISGEIISRNGGKMASASARKHQQSKKAAWQHEEKKEIMAWQKNKEESEK